MNEFPQQSARALEVYRPWLQVLAAAGVDFRLRGKIDLSGIVQQSLTEAAQVSHDRQPAAEQARRAWLRTILGRNLTDEIRRLRAERRDMTREQSLEISLMQSSRRIQHWLAAAQSSPSAKLMKEERTEAMLKALSALPEATQSAIIMRYFQEIPLAEIAQQLDRTPAAVAGLLKRGLQQLRDQLQSRSSP